MKKYSLIISSIIILFLFLKLLKNYSEPFAYVSNSYLEGASVNLEAGVDCQDIESVLHDYLSDEDDAVFISKLLTSKLEKGYELNAISDLNKRIWQVPSNVVDSIGSNGFKNKLVEAEKNLGIDSMFNAASALNLKSSIILDEKYKNLGKIKVTVRVKDDANGFFHKIFGDQEKPVEGVIVRLSVHSVDSLINPTSEVLSYLKTGSNGQVVFDGLNPNLSYSVLPIRKGYEYGPSKGTVGGNLSSVAKDGLLECSFVEDVQTIRLFDAETLNQIKADRVMTVRTPDEFKNKLTLYVVLFFCAWWSLYLLACRRSKNNDNGVFIAILMLLTGICMLSMFSLNDPLTDKLLGVDMTQGILCGVFIMMLLLNVDFVKFYQNKSKIGFDLPLACIKWIFKPFRQKVAYLTNALSDKNINGLLKSVALVVIVACLPMLILDLMRITKLSNKVAHDVDKFPKGSGYLFFALLLTLLLFTPLGASVGGMRVNLQIGFVFQPSEIAKYLIIIFMAAYFSVNANNIISYSKKGNAMLFGAKLKMMFSILIGLAILMGLYLILGDMGPALVLAFTFIILYSIIKSKVDLDGLNEHMQLYRIMTCDLAMLIYGIISFIAFLYVGNAVGNMVLGCIAWFVVWIAIGVAKKQIFESPIFFNLILSAFIFGGGILSEVASLNSVGERLENRIEMCTNTWGTLPINGLIANAGDNTQVAEGLWGLASGGIWGQGLGQGSPRFIPAFHTDMILESIGEQLGFIGIFAIIVLISLLLRRTILLGYKTTHPFVFYLCLGIAIVTSVQFILISLGSIGIIPLTGVTVPFLSYGKVSMILNLAAFGVILSVSKYNIDSESGINKEIIKLQKKNIGKYNYSVSILCWIYNGITSFICIVFLYYQFINRDDVLIKPVYVNNSMGVPMIEYNPRIAQLTDKMYAGDIYDRNGILLATSDVRKLSQENSKQVYLKYGLLDSSQRRQKRYYPFKEHLFFMLGDFNTKLYFSSDENTNLRGYAAESRHLSELRGYDNKLKSEDGMPIKVDLYSDEYCPGRFYPSTYSISRKGVQLRDYSALIPYLKAGINSKKLTRLNEREKAFWEIGALEPKDIQLTIDAELQTKLQQEMPKYIANQFEEGKWSNNMAWNKLRISIVILDAEHGDLLASANYPLPNCEMLKTAPDIYSDNFKEYSWKAYTDRDLGLTRATAPGSTAKVMSALAGLRKLGTEVADPTNNDYIYYVDPNEKVGKEPTGYVSMQKAIVESSNCYFINLVNDHNLYDDLAYIYNTVGAELNGIMPYCLDYSESLSNSTLKQIVDKAEGPAVDEYIKYVDRGIKEKMNKSQTWFWCWGQGSLWATPLTMARVVSIVENDGRMPVTKFVMDQKVDNVSIVSPKEAGLLNAFMKEEAIAQHIHNSDVGGKTGTAERDIRDARGHYSKPNDGWFICFIDNANIRKLVDGKDMDDASSLAIAVRMERLGSGMSGQAVNLTKDVVLPVLKELEYID